MIPYVVALASRWPRSYVRAFLSHQHAYFAWTNGREGAAARDERRRARFDALRRCAIRAGFVASAVLVVFALMAWFRLDIEGGPEVADLRQGRIIFFIDTAAIATALCIDSVERRGFREHAKRYELMAGMYRRALLALDDSAKTPFDTGRAVIAEVGHEALTENGDWILLHRAQPIELLQIGSMIGHRAIYSRRQHTGRCRAI